MHQTAYGDTFSAIVTFITIKAGFLKPEKLLLSFVAGFNKMKIAAPHRSLPRQGFESRVSFARTARVPTIVVLPVPPLPLTTRILY